jgi:hypothetical protein
VATKRAKLEKTRRAKWAEAKRRMAPVPEMPPPDLGLTYAVLNGVIETIQKYGRR